ncbi:MAG TPA: SUMF1/EgtB/PvdO family nonheme iron enzyme, partial [Polyangiaceae bacterium]|nr:SUMF1/EgtB/PvdO family nonheme iron enzyme [Polyangiaceae bacterium]
MRRRPQSRAIGSALVSAGLLSAGLLSAGLLTHCARSAPDAVTAERRAAAAPDDPAPPAEASERTRLSPPAATSPSAASAPPAPVLTPEAPLDIPKDMALVPAGKFQMGADNEGEQDERPAHEVSVAAFLLDLTEVTNAAYRECVDAKICRAASTLEDSRLTNGMAHVFRRPTHPVAGVSWDDAKAYCEWKGKRLPTEAEWERTARADDNRRYVWGNEEPDKKRHGVFGGKATTEPVGSYPEGNSAYGHFDLAGNVWEWVADDYDPFAYQRSTRNTGTPGSCAEIEAAQNQLRKEGKQGYTGTNPIPNECEKVLRGGAYNYKVEGLRNSNRVHHPAR